MPARPANAEGDETETVVLRGRTVRSASRYPGVAGAVRVSSAELGVTTEIKIYGLDRGDIICREVDYEDEIVTLGLTNRPSGEGEISLVASPPDLLALLMRAIGVVKRTNLQMGLPHLPHIRLGDIEPAEPDQDG